MSILKQANEILKSNSQDKERQYGGIVESLTRTAIVVSEMTNKNFTAKDVCMVFIASKFMREAVSHKEDNLVDAVAYTEMLNQVINQELKSKK